MPRSIYQYRRGQQRYIGETITGVQQGDPVGKVPVLQWVDNGWVQLNADLYVVDFSITHIEDTSAWVVWEHNYDVTQSEVEVVGVKTYRIIDTTVQHAVFTGLTPNTTYTVNMRAYEFGMWLPDVSKSFTTDEAQVPAQTLGLHYTNRSNTSISLAWNIPAGAVSYEVYRAIYGKPYVRVGTPAGTSFTVNKLVSDTRYSFKVRAVNLRGRSGPYSATVRMITGHPEKRLVGSCERYALPVRRTGSWRPDIQWGYWPGWPHGGYNYDVYQGYWQYTNKRYRGIVEYDPAALRAAIDKRFGSGVGAALHVSRVEIRRVKRRPEPGAGAPLELHWRLTNCQVRASKAQPAIYQLHVNNADSADAKSSQRSIRRGQTIDFLRLPRSWGEAIIRGVYNGTKVNGIALYRSDNDSNGYGYAGYLSLCADGEGSYWDLMVSANWNLVTVAYAAPKDW